MYVCTPKYIAMIYSYICVCMCVYVYRKVWLLSAHGY